MKLSIIVFLVVLVFCTTYLFSINAQGPNTVMCDTCSLCASKINSEAKGTIVKLIDDIETTTDERYCIEWIADNITLDCDGHKITNKFSSSDWEIPHVIGSYGIYFLL